jgi:hypothetical protein
MTGAELVALAETKIGQRYTLGAQADLEDPNYAGPWDCADFASWLAYQATGKRIGCTLIGDPFSGSWARVRLRITPDRAMWIPGAVFVRAPSRQRRGHVAISDGRGGIIEAHSTKRGVCRASALRRGWTTAVLIPGVEYGISGYNV